MSASPKSVLLASSLAAAVMLPCLVDASDARAQAAPPQGAAVSVYPTCTSKPTPQDTEAARSAYLLGKRFFDESDYGSAIHNFVDAYKLDCTKPELLLNVARANELLGNRAEAVQALETYLQRDQTLSADQKVQYQRRIDNLKAAMAAQSAAPAPTVHAATAPAAAPVPVPTSAAAPPAPSAPPAPPGPGGQHTIAPWIVAGVGGAAVIAGGIIYLVGASDVSSAKNSCPNGTCPKGDTSAANQGNTGDNLEKAGAVAFYVGLGAVAVGILWHFLEPTAPASPEPAHARFAPVIGPGFAGGSFVGSF